MTQQYPARTHQDPAGPSRTHEGPTRTHQGPTRTHQDPPRTQQYPAVPSSTQLWHDLILQRSVIFCSFFEVLTWYWHWYSLFLTKSSECITLADYISHGGLNQLLLAQILSKIEMHLSMIIYPTGTTYPAPILTLRFSRYCVSNFQIWSLFLCFCDILRT